MKLDKLKTLLLASTTVAGLAAFGATSADAATTICAPGTGPFGGASATTGCNLVITFNANGSITTSGVGGNYDGNDDAVIGVINNTAGTITSFGIQNGLSSTMPIFGFDGDGINTFSGVTNAAAGMSQAGLGGGPADADAYGGAQAFYTGVNAALTKGTVNFLGGIASGATGYFSLESSIDLAGPPVIVTGTPEPGTLALLGGGLAGLAMLRRRRKKV
jgi:hypothetical protein